MKEPPSGGFFYAKMSADPLRSLSELLKTMSSSLEDGLSQLLPLLDEQDLQGFQQLLQRMNAAGGEIEKMSEQDKAMIGRMAQKYARLKPKIIPPDQQSIAADTASTPVHMISAGFMSTGFAAFVRETLNAEICPRGGTLADAVNFAYTQKWLPDSLKDEAVCTRLYAQYQRDIEAANAFRVGLQDPLAIPREKTMALGLTWFSYIYRMQQLLLQGVDLDQT